MWNLEPGWLSLCSVTWGKSKQSKWSSATEDTSQCLGVGKVPLEGWPHVSPPSDEDRNIKRHKSLWGGDEDIREKGAAYFCLKEATSRSLGSQVLRPVSDWNSFFSLNEAFFALGHGQDHTIWLSLLRKMKHASLLVLQWCLNR